MCPQVYAPAIFYNFIAGTSSLTSFVVSYSWIFFHFLPTYFDNLTVDYMQFLYFRKDATMASSVPTDDTQDSQEVEQGTVVFHRTEGVCFDSSHDYDHKVYKFIYFKAYMV